MNWLMMDYFFPTLPVILTEYIKPGKKIFCIVFMRNLTSPACLSGPKTEIAGKQNLNIASNIKYKTELRLTLLHR